MHKSKYLLIFIILLTFSGCELSDKIEREIDRIKNQYEEYTSDGEPRGDKPFTVIYQQDENAKTAIISSACASNNPMQYTYYQTPSDAHRRFLLDTKNLLSYPGQSILKPFWDIRYVNPVRKYIDGGEYSYYPNHAERTGLDVRSGNRNIGVGTVASETDVGAGIAQSECINGVLTAGTTINLYDAPEQYITYAGPQSTFAYRVGTTARTSPWRADGKGNLMIQGYFDKPLYFNYGGNLGGGVYIGLFIRNKISGKYLNFVIGVYAAGTAWQQEKSGIKFDPTTNIVHVATVIKESSWWSTISPSSKSIQEIFSEENEKTSDDGKWNDFYRVNISYQNLLAVLQELRNIPPEGAEGQDFGLNPEDWEITNIMVQYELEETGGKATFSGSFSGFEVYSSEYPL